VQAGLLGELLGAPLRARHAPSGPPSSRWVWVCQERESEEKGKEGCCLPMMQFAAPINLLQLLHLPVPGAASTSNLKTSLPCAPCPAWWFNSLGCSHTPDTLLCSCPPPRTPLTPPCTQAGRVAG
jgi:hypothetical protein